MTTQRCVSATLVALVTSCALACGPAPHSKAAGSVATLAVRPVAWNAQNAAVAKVDAVADAGDVVCVLTEDGATVLSAKAVVAHDDHVKGWTWGGTIYSNDGDSTWLAGIDRAGHIHRLRGMTSFEDVTARYGFGARRVLGASITGPSTVALFLEREIALAASEKTTRYAAPLFSSFAGGGGYVAGVVPDGVDLINTTNAQRTHFDVPGAAYAALDKKGRLYVATRRAVYAADGAGASLALVYDAGGDHLHGLVASGDRLWFADKDELGTIENDRVAMTAGSSIARDARLSPSPTGDVWILAKGKLDRFEAIGGGAGEAKASRPIPTWSSNVAPVFARSCSACHQANGVSGVDLSNEAAWNDKRAVIRERVLVAKTMPPKGHPLSDADRAAIETWLGP